MSKDIWYLENFNFHAILCPVKMEKYADKRSILLYNKNDSIYGVNDPCDDIYLIDKGKVKLAHYDENGNEHVITFLREGEILGQMALIGDTRHRVFAQAMVDGTQICRMSIVKAKELCRDYVPFAIEMNRSISNHVRRLERRIEVLLCKNVKSRLIEFILDLGREYGRARDGGIWISHSLTQSDIAALLGISRKSASLMLNELEQGRFIQFDRRHIYIIDIKRLEKLLSNVSIQAVA